MPEQIAPKTPVLAVRDAIPLVENVAAPFLFFDQCRNFGFNDGICNVTLEATRFTAHDNLVSTERVQVAHLRMGLRAAYALKEALDKALLMGKPHSRSAD